MFRIQSSMCGLLTLVVLAGCSGDSDTPNTGGAAGSGPSAAGERFILASEPDGATDVIAAREHAEDDADIVVVGRIGGDVDPWVEGVAAFTIVDDSLPACSDIEGDTCPTPWDYCCATGVADARTLVKFVGDDGQPVETDARELLGLTELDTVVVQGKAERDADGNLSILASSVFVRPPSDRPQVPASEHTHSHDHDHDHAHSDNDGDAEEPDGDHEHSHEHAEAEQTDEAADH